MLLSVLLILVTLMLCALTCLVHSLALVILGFLEMVLLVKVRLKSYTTIVQLMILNFNVDINECATPNPCDTNAVCADDHGSFSCTCNGGYSGDGFTCQSKPSVICIMDLCTV